MIELHIAGVLDKCNTFPHNIDIEQISHLPIKPFQLHFISELIEALGSGEEDSLIKKALESIPQWKYSRIDNGQDILNSKSYGIIKLIRPIYSASNKVKSQYTGLMHKLTILFKNPNRNSFINLACHLPVIGWLLGKLFQDGILLWYWNEDKNYVNFGDYITKMLLQKFGYKGVEYCNARLLNILNIYDFCLLGIGSNLNKNTLDQLNVKKVYVWGQGKGFGDFFDIHKEPYCSKIRIYAVRGPHTISQLKLNGNIPQGDPAFLMPAFFKVRRNPSQYQITYIPHWSNRVKADVKTGEIGAERFVDIMCSKRKFWLKLNEIVSSKFVLTNSLHAAIVCHAYQIPWALCLAEGDKLNFPDKWKDLFEFLNIEHQFQIVKDYTEGQKWWEDVGSKAKTVDLLPLLDSFPIPFKNKKTLLIINKMKLT